MLSFFPLDILDEIWDLIETVSEGFLTYSYNLLLGRSTFSYKNSICKRNYAGTLDVSGGNVRICYQENEEFKSCIRNRYLIKVDLMLV